MNPTINYIILYAVVGVITAAFRSVFMEERTSPFEFTFLRILFFPIVWFMMLYSIVHWVAGLIHYMINGED